MKKFYSFRFIAIVFLIAGFSKASTAQDVYFREGFEGSITWGSDVASGNTPAYYSGAASSGVGTWYSYGTYRTNGSSTNNCSGIITTIGISHLRMRGVLPDSAYLITPTVGFGVGTFSFINGRATRGFTIAKTSDTSAASATWVNVVYFPTSTPACDGFVTVQINDPNAKRIRITSRGGTDSDVDSIVMTSTSPIVPVKFTGINDASVNGFTKVSWNIATELNTRSYIVEKSTDGINFKNVAEVAATNAGTYSWIDQSLTPVGNVYYRVKSVDKDGKLGFSGVIRLASDLTKPGFLITPNVISGRTLNLQLTNLVKGSMTVRVSNNMGQVVYTSSLLNEGGSVSKSISLPTSLQAGTYRVQLVSGSTLLTQTAILQ